MMFTLNNDAGIPLFKLSIWGLLITKKYIETQKYSIEIPKYPRKSHKIKKKHRIRNPKDPSKSHTDSIRIPEPENCLPPSRPQEVVSLSPAEAETPAKTAFWSPGAEKKKPTM